MKKIFFTFFLILIFSALLVSCGSKDPFIKEGKIPKDGEYVADIVVIKKGFWFLWFIPLTGLAGTENNASEFLVSEARREYPNAIGVYQDKVLDSYGWIYWSPRVEMTGKIVVKKDPDLIYDKPQGK